MNTNQKASILIVDDDPDVLDLTMQLVNFKFPQIKITGANTFAEGLNIVEDPNNEFELGIFDFECDPQTGKGGDVLAFKTKKRKDSPKVIIYSGAMSSRSDEITKCQADYFLPKPFEAVELYQMIQSLLGLNCIAQEPVSV